MNNSDLIAKGFQQITEAIESINSRLRKLEDKIHFLEEVDPYDPAKDEEELLKQLKIEANLNKGGWY